MKTNKCTPFSSTELNDSCDCGTGKSRKQCCFNDYSSSTAKTLSKNLYAEVLKVIARFPELSAQGISNALGGEIPVKRIAGWRRAITVRGLKKN